MLYNLFSQIQCVLKVNGIYKGIINLNPTELELSSQDFIEFIPLENLQSITFILAKESPQIKVAKTNICNYIFPLYFLPKYSGYKKLYSTQENNYHLQIVLDGVCKITLSTESLTHTEIVPFKPNNISVFYKDSRYIGLLFALNINICVILDVKNCTTIFYKQVEQAYHENDVIYTLIRPSSILCHTVIYKIKNGEITRQISRNKEPYSLTNQSLFCFAFLECVSLKDDISPFLAEGLPQDKIVGFLGDYDYILPCNSPLYDFALVGESIKFVKFKVENGKIIDLETT